MVFGKLGLRKKTVLGSCMAVAAVCGGMTVALYGQNQQQSVPDAPVPQALPKLNTITPVAPAMPDAPTVTGTTTTETAADGQTAVPNALPETQAPLPPEQHPDDDAPPEGTSASSFKFVTNTQFVEIPFTVKDSKGKQVYGLTYRDVRVYENGLRQSMKFFTTDPFLVKRDPGCFLAV
jgi:hypothetical protein